VSRDRNFENNLRGLTSVHHAGEVARMVEGNMFLYGPPGGAKSMYVDWMLRGEEDKAFNLQMHQMVTEQAFVGGQDFEAAKRGEFTINTKGSLADHVIGVVDESEKGSPASFASMLGLLNER